MQRKSVPDWIMPAVSDNYPNERPQRSESLASVGKGGGRFTASMVGQAHGFYHIATVRELWNLVFAKCLRVLWQVLGVLERVGYYGEPRYGRRTQQPY